MVGDRAAVRWNGAVSASPPDEINAVATLLSPVLGTRARRRAEALFRAFGSISGVSAASAKTLGQILGRDDDPVAGSLVSRGHCAAQVNAQTRREQVNGDNPALLDWLIARFAGLANESLIAVYRDGDGWFSCEETFCSGARECVVVHPSALFRHAVRLDRGGLLLAHNHPSGDTRPSALDIDATRRIAAHARLLDVELIDHLIIAGNSVTSMKRAGLL
jgi:DNA repair protein RadC